MVGATHEVTNQVPEVCDYNVYETDRILREAVHREGGAHHEHVLSEYGAWLGLRQTLAKADEANRCVPRLDTHDRWGRRVDQVHFNASWHDFMRMGVARGLHAAAWDTGVSASHVGRAAGFFLHGQIEAGSLCPFSMTSAAIPVLRGEAWFSQIDTRLCSREYDERDLPIEQKRGMTIGMGMTEKQGGSDLRANTTRAMPVGAGGNGGAYRLVGHKWFFSVPTSDAHLVLARHDEQLSCFYVPRWRPDGSRNPIHIQRLKNKLGNRSNASGEVEFAQSHGILVGEPGQGIALLLKMASLTRLDCVLGSAALLRQALVQALNHATAREAFGHPLMDQPLMRSVLVDLALESEAATTIALRLARAFDNAEDPLEHAYRRILTPAAKFWICKRAIAAVAECMEVWGGNGYVEDGPMPRLYRESPVNSIWEGSGNIMSLDVLRAIKSHPEQIDALLQSWAEPVREQPLLADALQRLKQVIAADADTQTAAARYVAQELVLLAQAVLLLHCAPVAVAEGFIASRFSARAGRVFGVSRGKAASRAILQRAWQVGD